MVTNDNIITKELISLSLYTVKYCKQVISYYYSDFSLLPPISIFGNTRLQISLFIIFYLRGELRWNIFMKMILSFFKITINRRKKEKNFCRKFPFQKFLTSFIRLSLKNETVAEKKTIQRLFDQLNHRKCCDDPIFVFFVLFLFHR